MLFCVSLTYAENIKYVYKDVFQFQLPNTLEIKFDDNIDKNCISYSDNTCHINKTLANEKIVWCQKGLNSPKSVEVFEQYCRVIIKLEEVDNGEVPGRFEDFVMDEETWEYLFESAKQEYEITGQKIIKRMGFEKIDFNGYPGIYISFLRTGWKNTSPVIVYQYTIFNSNKICKISFSYRENEAKMWSSIKNDIARTFTFDLSNNKTSIKNYDVLNQEHSQQTNLEKEYPILIIITIIIVIFLIVSFHYKKIKI